MKFETTFSCGDKAWAFIGDRVRMVTIGMVRVECTESEGIDQEGIQYDNYKAQKSYKEHYMCVETGIGSGSVYTLGEHIFKTEEECTDANKVRIAEKEAEEKRRKDYETELLLAEEIQLRAKLEKIEQIKSARNS